MSPRFGSAKFLRREIVDTYELNPRVGHELCRVRRDIGEVLVKYFGPPTMNCGYSAYETGSFSRHATCACSVLLHRLPWHRVNNRSRARGPSMS